MKGTWSLQDAKSKFSQVVKEAQKTGPQVVTKRGIETVIIISITDYKRLTKPNKKLTTFFRESPLYGIDLDFKRSKELSREVEF